MTTADRAIWLLLFSLLNVDSVAGDCLPPLLDGGHVCYSISEDMIIGEEASVACLRNNGKLPRVEVVEEANRDSALGKLLDKGRHYWLQYAVKSETYEYPTGKSIWAKAVFVAQFFLKQGHCSLMKYDKTWYYGHAICDITWAFYICEHEKARLTKTITERISGGNTTTGGVSTLKVPREREERQMQRKAPQYKLATLLHKGFYITDPPAYEKTFRTVTMCTRECLLFKDCKSVNFNLESGQCRVYSTDSKTRVKDQETWQLWVVQ